MPLGKIERFSIASMERNYDIINLIWGRKFFVREEDFLLGEQRCSLDPEVDLKAPLSFER